MERRSVNRATPSHRNDGEGAREALRRPQRTRFSPEQRGLLNSWVQQNQENPYMGLNEKKRFARRTGLTVRQITLWLINVRRVLSPCIYLCSDS